MIFPKLTKTAVWVSAVVFAVSLLIALPGAIASDECNLAGCEDDCTFTTDFQLERCRFRDRGINPYFILRPCYQLVLESEEEKEVITVLRDREWIDLGDRQVKTRVVEERAYELDEDEWKLIEISRNFFAICKHTNDVYYFGEDSADCEDGFADNEKTCEDGSDPDTEGSWRVGENDAQPGLIMPGTFLLGSRYFQEQSPEDEAVDRGENVSMGLTVVTDAGTFEDCVEVIDTNPAEGVCSREDGDSKKYCPGIGLVMDEDLELTDYGFVRCNARNCDDQDCDGDNDDEKRSM